MRGRWWKWSRRRRRLLFAVLLLAAALPIANETTRRVSERMLGSFFEGAATVERVRLGIRNIHVKGITVWSRDCDEPVVAIDSIAARVSILDGLRHGVWIAQVVVDHPELQLHFDEYGKLITHVPESNTEAPDAEPITNLPFHSIVVRSARIAVHQVGRAPFQVSDIALEATGDGSQLTLTADAPKVFSGRIAFRSTLDIVSLTGESTVQISGLNVNSKRLVELPLVPASVHTHPWHATSSLRLKQTGSFANIENLGASVDLVRLRISMSDRPDIVDATGRAQIRSGEFASNVDGRLLGGRLTLSSAGSISDVSTGTLQIECIELDSSQLPEGLFPPNVATELAVSTTLDATYANGKLQLRGSSTSRTSNTNAMGIAIAPTTVQLDIDGTSDRASAESRLRGLLSATIVSDGVSLEQLAANGIKRLPLTVPTESDTVPHQPRTPKLPEFITPSGQIRAAARIEIPLATIGDPRTYFVKGSVDATDVVVNDILVQNGKGEFALENNKPSANFSNIVLIDRMNGQESSLTAVASTTLDQTSNVQAALRIRRLSAATIARFANFGDRNVDGEILARVILNCPLDRINDPSVWHGEAIVEARTIRVDDEPLANCTTTCQLENGVCFLQTNEGEFAGGKLAGSATIKALKPYPFRVDAKIQRLLLNQVGKLVGMSRTAISGSVDGSFTAAGVLQTKDWKASGQLAGSQLRFGSRDFDERIVIHVVLMDSLAKEVIMVITGRFNLNSSDNLFDHFACNIS